MADLSEDRFLDDWGFDLSCSINAQYVANRAGVHQLQHNLDAAIIVECTIQGNQELAIVTIILSADLILQENLNIVHQLMTLLLIVSVNGLYSHLNV